MTDQPNISTRSHRKNGNNGKKKEQSIIISKTSIISGDKAISQNIFLSEFLTEQTQSFNIFINEIIHRVNISLKTEIFENMVILQIAIANLDNSFKSIQSIGLNSFNSKPHRNSLQKSIVDNAFY